MHTFVLMICLLLVSGMNSGALAQESGSPNVPQKELVQYIRDAKKTGQNDFQIQQNAINSGWPQTAVNEAIAYVKSTDKNAAAPPAKAAVEKETPSKPPAPTTNPASGGSSAPPAASVTDPSITTPADKAKASADRGDTKHAAVNRGVPDDYKIGAGDVIEINVWKEPDVTVKGAVVRPDGKISMPVLKEVYVVGLTPVELEKQITDGLANSINSPDVTIVVTGINSKKIYVTGKVKKEGPIPYTYRMTVMQALSEAGGISEYAKKKAIYILHNENGREFRFTFDYSAVLKGERMEKNISLEPGDVIVVP